MPAAADALREQGNAEFKAGAFLKAAATYTKALQADSGNAVLYRCVGPRHGRMQGRASSIREPTRPEAVLC